MRNRGVRGQKQQAGGQAWLLGKGRGRRRRGESCRHCLGSMSGPVASVLGELPHLWFSGSGHVWGLQSHRGPSTGLGGAGLLGRTQGPMERTGHQQAPLPWLTALCAD